MPRTAALLRTRRFWPLCVTQACGALNDNLVKNAMVVLALYRLGAAGPVIVALSGGLFILPYVLFSATAGQLADRHDKARLIRAMKIAELALAVLAAVGFLAESVPLLLAVLVGLGLQATFFGPLKYGIIPDHLAPEELVAGNGMIEATTFLAILAGTIAGGALILLPGGTSVVSAATLAVAGLGLLAAGFVPPAPPRGAPARPGWNIAWETARLVRLARQDPLVWRPILGIGWFWTMGATLLAEFPVIAKATLGAGGEVVTLFLTMFSVGVGIGSMLAPLLLRGQVSARFVPAAALGISAFTLDFAFTSAGARGLVSVPALLGSAAGLHMLADLLLLAACGGLYSVPLYALIQEHAAPDRRARVIGANNVVNAAFMVAGAGVAAALAVIGVPAPRILMAAGVLNFGAWYWARRLTAPGERLSAPCVRR